MNNIYNSMEKSNKNTIYNITIDNNIRINNYYKTVNVHLLFTYHSYLFHNCHKIFL